MSSFWRKVCWGRAVGAHLTKGRVVLTEIASTPVGLAVLNRDTQAVGDQSPAETLKQWCLTHLTPRQRRHVPVCVGIAGEQAFFTTRFLDGQQRKESPSAAELLEACGASHAWEKEEAASDFVRTKLPGGQAYSLAAAKRELAEEIFAALQGAGVRSARMEPAPWSLLAAADREASPPPKWRNVVRVLLLENDGLAILAVGGRPALWRRFPVDRRSPAFSITSAIRVLQIYARQNFDLRSICGVFLQGHVGDGFVEQVREDVGLAVEAGSGSGPTDDQYSLGLALSAKNAKGRSLDLLRGLRPAPSIREIFPWSLAGLTVFLGVCMALLLWNESTALAAQCESFERRNVAHPWAQGLTMAAVNKERDVLLAEVAAVRRFLTSRIIWSDYLRDLPTRLPTNACLSSISGFCELEDTGKKKQERKSSQCMTLRGMARFSDRGQAPREIDAFLESLRGMDLLKRDFPHVQLAEIRWRREGHSEIAQFTILALPKKTKTAG